MKLSILILSITDRAEQLKKLTDELDIQIELYNLKDSVEILTEIDNKEKTIGDKRNIVKAKAKGEYICFIDDDDMVSEDYLSEIFIATESNPEIITFQVQRYIRYIPKNISQRCTKIRNISAIIYTQLLYLSCASYIRSWI